MDTNPNNATIYLIENGGENSIFAPYYVNKPNEERRGEERTGEEGLAFSSGSQAALLPWGSETLLDPYNNFPFILLKLTNEFLLLTINNF